MGITIDTSFASDIAPLRAARERRFRSHIFDRKTTLEYEHAIDYFVNHNSMDEAALVAVEARQYSKAIELYASRERWEDAAFVAKIAGKCEAARDFYKKAGNAYYARRMEENIAASKKSA